jgi:hypothetical protein
MLLPSKTTETVVAEVDSVVTEVVEVVDEVEVEVALVTEEVDEVVDVVVDEVVSVTEEVDVVEVLPGGEYFSFFQLSSDNTNISVAPGPEVSSSLPEPRSLSTKRLVNKVWKEAERRT